MVENQWILIFGMAVVTMLPRILPLFILGNRDLSPEIVKWMAYIPVTIFSALVFSDIFFWEEQFSIDPILNIKLIPSLIVAFISVKIDNLFISMIAGIFAISLMFWAVG